VIVIPADIASNVRRVLASLPAGVTLVAAAKSRTADEVRAAIAAGVGQIGHNYVREAEAMLTAFGPDRGGVRWRMIGHLQRNKARDAVRVFDAIDTVDSLALAVEIDRRCGALGRTMDVLVEVNSAREVGKSGVLPEDVEDLVRAIAALPNVRVRGLMTMGPLTDDPEDARPFFRATRTAFDRLVSLGIPNVDLTELSMGMSDSYMVALAEGANAVRIGTRLFGPRTEAAR
jgi:PLP dependent protein